jgi:UDP-N-acetylmuramate dehydrogenase
MNTISQALEVVQYKLPKIKMKLGEQMKNRTSIKIGGPVRVMFFPEKIDELTSLYELLCECGVAPVIIGNGTNLLVDDKPLELAVITTMGINTCERTSGSEITVGAGALMSKVSVFASECGLSGLEFAHGIPGTLGGAIYMNAGAYGGEMKDVVQRTTASTPDGRRYTVIGTEHGFSNRHSRFTDHGDVILSSILRLQKSEITSIRDKMDELYSRRHESQPLDLPSAGSIFKRPEVGYAGSLIEQAGLKGYISGDAQISEKHAGFIVNRGGATFSDVMKVIEHTRETVKKMFDIELELEIKIIK